MVALNENAITLLGTATGIDATATGTTPVYTVPVGKTMIPDHVVIRVTSFTIGPKATQAVGNFGGNAANYNDYIAAATYTIAASQVFIRDGVEGSAKTIQAAGDVFSCRISRASDATTEVWEVKTFGHLY